MEERQTAALESIAKSLETITTLLQKILLSFSFMGGSRF